MCEACSIQDTWDKDEDWDEEAELEGMFPDTDPEDMVINYEDD